MATQYFFTKNHLTMYKILSFDQAARRTSDTLEFLTLAPTPHNETCTAAGDSHEDGIKECIALINQLQRIHGQAPAGAEFFVVRNYHEFGTYFEAGIFYEVLQELREMQHSKYQPAKIIQLKRA